MKYFDLSLKHWNLIVVELEVVLKYFSGRDCFERGVGFQRPGEDTLKDRPLQARVVFGNHENSSSVYTGPLNPSQIHVLNPCTQGSFPEICKGGWTSLIEEVIMTGNTVLSHSAAMC